jgi:tRNA A-37 threonylcarbamoyl transferase component Bud32
MADPNLIDLTNVVWHLAPELQSQIPPAEWLREDRATVVKHGTFRTVWQVTLPNAVIYLKQCRPTGLRAWIREWLRPAKGLLEFRKASAIAGLNVPVPPPLGWGRRRGYLPTDSFVVTHSVAGTETLDRCLTTLEQTPPNGNTSARRKILAVALGEFLARLHESGVAHPDLHPGNLLIRWDGNTPSLFLIDLHDVELHSPLSWSASRASLALFNRWFIVRASRTDRLRFWHAYCHSRRSHPAWQSKTLINRRACEVERATWQSNLRFWRGRASRCLGDNRHFQRIHETNFVGHAVRDIGNEALRELLRDPDAPFRDGRNRLIKESRSTTIVEMTLTVGVRRVPVIYKRFRARARFDATKSLFRKPPALRSWCAGHGLRDACLQTPRPIAVWHRCRRGRLLEGYLIVEKIVDAIDLCRYSHELRHQIPERRSAMIRETVQRIARAVREMHQRRWMHMDLKANNLLISASGTDVWFIDLAGAMRIRAGYDCRLRDLARLNVSFINDPLLTRTERLRFLRTWMDWAMRGSGGWKRLWRGIDQLTAKKVEQNRRSGRPLA